MVCCVRKRVIIAGLYKITQLLSIKVGYDRSVPRLRQADHCIGCNQCVPHCPQNIDIPAQMQRIDRFVEDLKQNREF